MSSAFFQFHWYMYCASTVQASGTSSVFNACFQRSEFLRFLEHFLSKVGYKINMTDHESADKRAAASKVMRSMTVITDMATSPSSRSAVYTALQHWRCTRQQQLTALRPYHVWWAGVQQRKITNVQSITSSTCYSCSLCTCRLWLPCCTAASPVAELLLRQVCKARCLLLWLLHA
jgi:hypothetical protein